MAERAKQSFITRPILSSYAYYAKKQKSPDWLYQQDIFSQLNVKTRPREKYRAFVERGVDEEIALFYGKGNTMPYLGSENFRDWAYSQRTTEEASITKENICLFRPSIKEMVTQVAKKFNVSVESILNSSRGRVENNIPRWVGLYLSQETGSKTLREIAAAFNLKQTGSIPTTIMKLRGLMEEDLRLTKKVRQIKSVYDT